MTTPTPESQSSLQAQASAPAAVPELHAEPLRGDEPVEQQADAAAYRRGWNSCRAAMLAAAPTPEPVAVGQQAVAQVPDAIRLMAQRIAADDFKHCTSDPIFTVEKRNLIIGLDLDYDCQVGWFHDGDQVTGDEAAALEAAYQESGSEPDDFTRTGIAESWEHHASYLTKEAAEAFVQAKGDAYRVYVDSGCRNHEWKALRAFLLQIAAPTPPAALDQQAVRAAALEEAAAAARLVSDRYGYGYSGHEVDAVDEAIAAIRALKSTNGGAA